MRIKHHIVSSIQFFVGAVFLLILPILSAGEDTSNWLQVKAWQGKFWTSHVRLEETERDWLGFSGETRIKDYAEGRFLFNRVTDSGTWTGEGSAKWSVDEYSKTCPKDPAVRCRETEAKGSGTLPLGGTRELSIDVIEGTYDLVLNLGGDYLEGMVVEYREIPLGGVSFEDKSGQGPVLTETFDKGDKGPGDVALVAYADAFHLYTDDSIPLPSRGNDLCGCEQRSDGTVIAWKIWPADKKEPACTKIDACGQRGSE